MMELPSFPDYFSWRIVQPRHGSELPTEAHELAEFAKERAEARLRHKPHLLTKLYALTPRGFLILTAYRMDEEDKEQFVTCARLLLAGYEATAVATSMEVWVYPYQEARQAQEPDEVHERQEAVSIMLQTRTQTIWELLPMRRDAAKRFLGFAQNIVKPTVKMTGRFAELLPPIPPSPAIADLCRAMLEEIRQRQEPRG